MKVEDVPDEWVRIAQRAYMRAPGSHLNGMASALAAVAPLIAAAERERCAKVALGVPVSEHTYGTDRNMAVKIAAAIRALDA
jgi:hypothetical protein